MSSTYDSLIKSFPIILAPMAGVSDVAFRSVCKELGADITFSEMVSAKGLSYANEKTHHLVDLAPNEDFIGVQLFGHEAKTMAEQAYQLCEEMGDSLLQLDINMGCPARKIVSKGDGASLMERPDEAVQIAQAVVNASKVPVSVKMRRGYDLDDETAPELAARMEAVGVSHVTIHGRFARQMYNGQADWGVIKRVKDRLSIPVIGNGDVTSGERACAMREETGVDGIMIARAAEGNPWIFSQVKQALAGECIDEIPSVDERIRIARLHTRRLAELSEHAIVRMRKHACWYCKGIPGATHAREMFNACTKLEEFEQTFEELLAHAHAFAEVYPNRVELS